MTPNKKVSEIPSGEWEVQAIRTSSGQLGKKDGIRISVSLALISGAGRELFALNVVRRPRRFSFHQHRAIHYRAHGDGYYRTCGTFSSISMRSSWLRDHRGQEKTLVIRSSCDLRCW